MDILFPNPPITEALIEIRTTLPKEVGLKDLASLHDLIKGEFPIKGERHTMAGGIQFNTGSVPQVISSPDRIDGFLFKTQNNDKVVQSRLDGFTFNKLKPYTNWKEFSEEGKHYWELYAKLLKPINVTRIALRYVNLIEVPLPIADFKEYFLTSPEIASELPQELSGMFMRLSILKEAIQSNAAITMTYGNLDFTKQITHWPFIFDIEVTNGNIYPSDSLDIWRKFQELRDFKNEIFIKSITKKTMELFK